jgi:hypothetical protein
MIWAATSLRGTAFGDIAARSAPPQPLITVDNDILDRFGLYRFCSFGIA